MKSLSSSFVLSTYVYHSESVSQAIDVFSGHCSIVCVNVGDDICVTIVAATEAPRLVAYEFLNYALNLSAERALREA
jgi:hypothetical protein